MTQNTTVKSSIHENNKNHVLQITNENLVTNSSYSDHEPLFGRMSFNDGVNQYIKNNVSVESVESLVNPPIYYEDDTTFTCLQRDQSYDSRNHQNQSTIK